MRGVFLLGPLLRKNGPGGQFFGKGIHQEADAQQDKGDAQKLAHVQGHVGLEGHLVVLDELDEEAAAEAHHQENAHEGSAVHLVQTLPIQEHEDNPQQQVGQALIELRGMARDGFPVALEDEAPGKVCRATVNL